MSATKTTLSFAILAATAGLMLVATADAGFARGNGLQGRPPCGGIARLTRQSRRRPSRTERRMRASVARQTRAGEVISSSKRR